MVLTARLWQSLETICLLLAFKIKYPENFFILRGNHECASINRIYGFYDECKRRYNIRLWKTFTGDHLGVTIMSEHMLVLACHCLKHEYRLTHVRCRLFQLHACCCDH